MVHDKPCLALIADIVASKKIPERGKFQRELKEELERINREQSIHLLSPYTITLGDEFQAVYRHYSTVVADIWRIIAAIYPQKIRFALGYGLLTTDINEIQAIGMDGPAFHQARRGINHLKEGERTLIRLEGENLLGKDLLNQSLELMSLHQDSWKERTQRIFWGMLEGRSAESLSQIEVEGKTISERAVYKQIHHNHLKEYVSFSETLSEFLTSLYE